MENKAHHIAQEINSAKHALQRAESYLSDLEQYRAQILMVAQRLDGQSLDRIRPETVELATTGSQDFEREMFEKACEAASSIATKVQREDRRTQFRKYIAEQEKKGVQVCNCCGREVARSDDGTCEECGASSLFLGMQPPGDWGDDPDWDSFQWWREMTTDPEDLR
jgi:hypothetical protein